MAPIVAAAALAAAGKLFKGITGFLGKNQEKKYLRQQAQVRRQEAGIESNVALEEGERVAARGAVVAAASGGGTGGSATAVLDDVARQSMFNARSAIYRGESEARNLTYQASVKSAEAKIELISSFVDAGSSFMSQTKQADAARR